MKKTPKDEGALPTAHQCGTREPRTVEVFCITCGKVSYAAPKWEITECPQCCAVIRLPQDLTHALGGYRDDDGSMTVEQRAALRLYVERKLESCDNQLWGETGLRLGMRVLYTLARADETALSFVGKDDSTTERSDCRTRAAIIVGMSENGPRANRFL